MARSVSKKEKAERKEQIQRALDAIHERRECLRAGDSLKYFFKRYLGHYFDKEFGEAQLELIDKLENDIGTGLRLARAEPREYGKTTILSMFILWCILYQKKKYILIISHSQGLASLILQSVVREIEDNDMILRDFGDLVGDKKWGLNEILTKTGIRVTCKGSGSSMRGVKSFEHRPDMIVIDDLEEDKKVLQVEYRDYIHGWLRKAVMSLVSKDGDVVMIGTIVHHDSVLKRILADKAWNAKIWAAIKDGKSTWEANWPMERLMRRKKELGSEAFAQEMMNDPTDQENQPFKSRFTHLYTEKDIVEVMPDGERQIKPMWNFMALDPAWSGSKKAHWASIIVVGVDTDNDWWIREMWRRHADEPEIVSEFHRLHKKYHVLRCGVETVFNQKSFKIAIEERMRKTDYWFGITDLKTSQMLKPKRIRGLIPRWEQGAIHIPEYDPNHKVILDELYQFPKAQTDDIVDALAYILELATPPTKEDFAEEAENPMLLSHTDDCGYVSTVNLEPEELEAMLIRRGENY